MFSIIWHYVVGWVFGLGGIATAFAVIAWALWFFTPTLLATYKSQLLHIAMILTVFCFTAAYFSTSFYAKGQAECQGRWDAANEKAARDKAAIEKRAADGAESVERAATEDEDKLVAKNTAEENQFAEKIKARADACALTDDDLGELRR